MYLLKPCVYLIDIGNIINVKANNGNIYQSYIYIKFTAHYLAALCILTQETMVWFFKPLNNSSKQALFITLMLEIKM